MTKGECEKAIRSLCGTWGAEKGITVPSTEVISFSEFRRWLDEKGYGQYLRFRSTLGPLYDAEAWFDDEMKQRWRN